jgi:hypothetical protein
MGRKDIELALGKRLGISRQPGETDQSLQERINRSKKLEMDRQDELDEVKHKAAVAKAEKEATEAQRAIDGDKASPAQAFQLKGSVDLGNFNYQEIMAKQEEDRKALEKEMKEQLSATGQINEDLRDRLHQAELKTLETTFSMQINQLKDLLTRATVNQAPLDQQIEAVKRTANAIGLNIGPQGTSETVNVELVKIQQAHELAIEAIKDAREESKRKWDLEIRRFDDEREARKQESEVAAKKNEIWANLPAQIGAAIVRGMQDAGQGGDYLAIDEQPAEGPSPNPQPKRKPGLHLEAPPGESGTYTCPDCEETMVIGPTATKAVCPNCDLEIPIRRVAEQA